MYDTNEFKTEDFEEMEIYEDANEYLTEAQFLLFKYIFVYGYDRIKLNKEFYADYSEKTINDLRLIFMEKIVNGLNDEIRELREENDVYKLERAAIDKYFFDKLKYSEKEYNSIFKDIVYDNKYILHKELLAKKRREKNCEKIIDAIKSIFLLEKERGYIFSFSLKKIVSEHEIKVVDRQVRDCASDNNSGICKLVKSALHSIEQKIQENEEFESRIEDLFVEVEDL